MNCCHLALPLLLQKQVHRLPRAGVMAGDRNGKEKIRMIKQILTGITADEGW